MLPYIFVFVFLFFLVKTWLRLNNLEKELPA